MDIWPTVRQRVVQIRLLRTEGRAAEGSTVLAEELITPVDCGKVPLCSPTILPPLLVRTVVKSQSVAPRGRMSV